jgi:hypothetical protein
MTCDLAQAWRFPDQWLDREQPAPAGGYCPGSLFNATVYQTSGF